VADGQDGVFGEGGVMESAAALVEAAAAVAGDEVDVGARGAQAYALPFPFRHEPSLAACRDILKFIPTFPLWTHA